MDTPGRRNFGKLRAIKLYAVGMLAVLVSSVTTAMANPATSYEISPPPAAIINSNVIVEPSLRALIPRADLEDWSRQTVGAAQTKGQFVGSGFALIRPEGPALSRGFGFGDSETGDAIHPGITLFPASGLGALLVAQILVDLEAHNRLELDNPVNGYLTRLALSPRHNRLTIRELFGNDTGLASSLRGSHLYKDQTDSANLDHIRALLKRSSIERQTNTSASPLAAALASLVVEDVSGKPMQVLLENRLKTEWNVAPWFNTVGAKPTKYVSRDHRILSTGEIRRAPLHAAARGFEASRGLYLTINDMANILAGQLTGLSERSQATRDAIDLAFHKSTAHTTVNGQLHSVEVMEIRSNVGTNSLHAVLVPELEIGFLALVNSSAPRPGFLQSQTGEGTVPLLDASDLVDSFMTRFIAPPESAGLAAGKARPALSSKPLFQRSSVSGLMALFLMSAVLQFALLASARWEASTIGQKISRGLGMASVVFMTATLTFPVALVFLEHSETLIDPLFLISQRAFPVAAFLALATMAACLLGWKNHFWGDERAGFHKRLCFTVGSAGLLGLAIVTWQLDLVIPVY